MMLPIGPDDHFTLLFDEHVASLPRLPEAFRAIYQGDWHPLSHPDRPYTYINFVASRDGRISFAEPGHVGGGDVACFSTADTWLMGLLRAGADAILVGDGTLHAEPGHLWTSEFIVPGDGVAFRDLREHWGLRPLPLHVVLSLEGRIDPEAAIFCRPELRILLATTGRGKLQAEARLQNCAADVEILDLGEFAVDLERLMRLLFERYHVCALLCEGGPRVYGQLLKAGLVDDEFLTLSPLMIGAEHGKLRPSLIEGVAFAPGQAPRSTLISLRRVQNHLFLRSRWTYHH